MRFNDACNRGPENIIGLLEVSTEIDVLLGFAFFCFENAFLDKKLSLKNEAATETSYTTVTGDDSMAGDDKT